MKIRSVKFKAKRLDNGEWVEGDLKHSTSYVGIGYPSSAFPDVPIVHRVDPDTVCQFVGLTDYNGKDLYEGDIVSFSDSENQVVWEDHLCAFVLVGVGEIHGYYVHCDILNNCPFYIIGNKFDKNK